MNIDTKNLVNGDEEFFYKDGDNFYVCMLCYKFIRFIFYIHDNEKLPIQIIETDNNSSFYCAKCFKIVLEKCMEVDGGRSPFGDKEVIADLNLLSFLEDDAYCHPLDRKMAPLDRIIITEQTKLHPSYRNIITNPAPKSWKVRNLIKLFNCCHYTKNLQYADQDGMFDSLEEKYSEISAVYARSNTPDISRPYDKIDRLVDKTPAHVLYDQQQENRYSQKPETLSPIRAISTNSGNEGELSISDSQSSDSDSLRSQYSQSQIPISSQSVIISQEERSQRCVLRDVNISSQSVNVTNSEPLNISEQSVPLAPLSMSLAETNSESLNISMQNIPLAQPVQSSSENSSKSPESVQNIILSSDGGTDSESGASVFRRPANRTRKRGRLEGTTLAPAKTIRTTPPIPTSLSDLLALSKTNVSLPRLNGG